MTSYSGSLAIEAVVQPALIGDLNVGRHVTARSFVGINRCRLYRILSIIFKA